MASSKRTSEQEAALRARQQANQAAKAQASTLRAGQAGGNKNNPMVRDPKTGKTVSRYPSYTRTALAPGLLGAIALLAAVAVIDTGWFTILQYAIAILALIICVFAWQAKQWWWIIGLVPIAVIWNPVVPLHFDPPVWYAFHLAAAIVFVASGLLIKIPVPQDK
ncbi:DUF6804 family protein [Subtercola endophyticus]|uniref:DUF6804 family protein n=1 Tax=Subtercola endophyticus TaxID=2895559 RepID=UPI001E5048EE|nr:DUF6804 family protein [Subtercola endophyticus]UFS60105.1 hypothetical protein LQ955_04870 [Subtercola endophyticus]